MTYQTIDLHWQGLPEVIASYALRGPAGVALIETGPASSYENLKAGLAAADIDLSEISDILVTHIHLDHAGAAGWLASETGSTVHVHHIGAPHLADPTKLLRSAGRIYGDAMDDLWGQTIPVPAEQVRAVNDGDIVEAAGLRIRALDTPGHAWHHMAWLLDGLCFSGDVTAVRLPRLNLLRAPTPPPEIDLPAWRASLARLRQISPDQLLPTHFGPSDLDTLDHLQSVEEQLDAQAAFVRAGWQAGQPRDDILEAYRAWLAEDAITGGLSPADAHRLEMIVPSDMCVDGLLRYLVKVVQR
ncbi:MAG: MBL fold metallo-hydrolase [Anaerolineae bacterium]|nr:MBL fold metallo-hydrolase [Anaerolineae bacterium]